MNVCPKNVCFTYSNATQATFDHGSKQYQPDQTTPKGAV